jgi:hypothetical protein
MQCSISHRQRAQTQSRVAREPIPLSERDRTQSVQVTQTWNKHQSTKRAAYSPKEFAASCGRHPSWAYRLLYGGKIRALTDLGRILIPASELERVLATATPYNPQPRKGRLPQIGSRGRRGNTTPVETPLSHVRAAKACDTRLEVACNERAGKND